MYPIHAASASAQGLVTRKGQGEVRVHGVLGMKWGALPSQWIQPLGRREWRMGRGNRGDTAPAAPHHSTARGTKGQNRPPPPRGRGVTHRRPMGAAEER